MKIPTKGFEYEITIHGTPPKNWELIRDGHKVLLQYKGKTVHKFPTNWSQKYKYFEYLFNNRGVHSSYKELYEYHFKRKYPERGKLTSINKSIQRNLNILKKELAHLPIQIDTELGAHFLIKDNWK